MDDRSAGTASYEDPLISVRDGTLTIRRYHFPTGAKHIRLEAITGVEGYRTTSMTGNWRIWGLGDLVSWFNQDPGRRHSSVGS
jgi:hypothetical protein